MKIVLKGSVEVLMCGIEMYDKCIELYIQCKCQEVCDRSIKWEVIMMERLQL